jgi:hypothetical protein
LRIQLTARTDPSGDGTNHKTTERIDEERTRTKAVARQARAHSEPEHCTYKSTCANP